MKIPLIYPKIPENSDKFHGKCLAFEKYDGTNLHWQWNASDGWNAFGTRRTQFPLTKNGIYDFGSEHIQLIDAPNIFNDTLRDHLAKYFLDNSSYRIKKIIVFTEFFGRNSFAGNHFISENHQLVIIDVMIDNKLLPPIKFAKDFIDFNSARVVYDGKYNGQFAEDIRNNRYFLNEGVVVKGVVDGEVFMTKIKTKEYLKRLTKR